MTPPAVRSGDEVTVKVSIGAVEVTGVGVASGSGQAGDVIRIMQPRSRPAAEGQDRRARHGGDRLNEDQP
jgi:flagella basal body P-ring formation protein FlgA